MAFFDTLNTALSLFKKKETPKSTFVSSLSTQAQPLGYKPTPGPYAPSSPSATTTYKPPATTPVKSTTTPTPFPTQPVAPQNGGYSTIPGPYDAMTGQLKNPPLGGDSSTGTPEQPKPKSGALDEYIKSLATANTRLADIQSTEETKKTAARRQYEALLDQSGGLKAGAQESAQFADRRNNSELADIALQESAAGRSAQVAQTAYDQAVTANKQTDQPATVQEYNYAKDNGYTGSFLDYQKETANLKNETSGLTPGQTQSTINQIAGSFDNEPIVKSYNKVAEGKAFVDSIPNDTQNPVDQQGVIYAFAKAMDPDSVVREGEYNTIQKYAQSWAQTFGFNAQRIFSNTPFLSPQAIANMKATINAKYNASKTNYDNVYNEYQRRVQEIQSGNVVNPITNYSGAYNTPQGGSMWDF